MNVTQLHMVSTSDLSSGAHDMNEERQRVLGLTARLPAPKIPLQVVYHYNYRASARVLGACLQRPKFPIVHEPDILEALIFNGMPKL